MDRLEVGWDAHGDDLGKDSRPAELVGERLERDRHPDHRPDPRTPDARRADHDVGRDLAAIREDRPDPAVVRPDVGDGVLAEERRATLHRAERLGLGDADRVGQAVGWHVIRTDDGVAIDERPQRRRLVGVDHPAGEAPRFGEVAPSVDLGQTFRRQSELQAADRVQTPPTVERQGPRLLDRIHGEFGHRLRRIGLEDDPGRVRGGPAGLVQRPLFDNRHVRPPAQDQLVRQRAADDPGSDDHDAWGPGHGRPSLHAQDMTMAAGHRPRRHRAYDRVRRRGSKASTSPRWRPPTSWRRPRGTCSRW